MSFDFSQENLRAFILKGQILDIFINVRANIINGFIQYLYVIFCHLYIIGFGYFTFSCLP
jgi:hypothetical protein